MPFIQASRRRLWVLLSCVVANVAYAEEAMDFFEYLSTLVEHDGEWVDALAMQENEQSEPRVPLEERDDVEGADEEVTP